VLIAKCRGRPFALRFFSCVIPSLCHPERIVSSRARSTSLRAGSAEGPGSFSTPADSPPTTDQLRRVTLKLHSDVGVIQSAAKNPGSSARNGGHSLRRGRKCCSAVEVFTKMFHVKHRLVQENKTRIPLDYAIADSMRTNSQDLFLEELVHRLTKDSQSLFCDCR
jgi:hypothetical protein